MLCPVLPQLGLLGDVDVELEEGALSDVGADYSDDEAGPLSPVAGAAPSPLDLAARRLTKLVLTPGSGGRQAPPLWGSGAGRSPQVHDSTGRRR